MSRPVCYAVVAGLLCAGVTVALLCVPGQSSRDADPKIQPEESFRVAILSVYQAGREYGGLKITCPLDGALFPPEIVAPTFRWKDERGEADTWLVTIEFEDDKDRLDCLATDTQWTPLQQQWTTIKQRSLDAEARVTVIGVKRAAPKTVLSADSITIGTSKDEVGAPLFYREVNLPFIDAVRDPSHIRWRLGSISSPDPPPVVLEKLPVCGNCHSFSADGTVLGMDVDYANSKGSYVITRVAEHMALATSEIITWNDYKREDGEQTFGLLSQVSPDGRYVVSTVKDKSVFVPKPDLAFSQLFFPLKGILVVYDRKAETFKPLPGADDPKYVQSNPSWSPDGKYIVFAKSEAYELKHTVGKGKVLLTREECKEFVKDGKPFLFDLYRIPFNGGKGGKPEPLKGASHNKMSNFFARYSPDGKWIVFCKAQSYMLLQPDSKLYIIPAEGGVARRLRCNTQRMNSWHSWSPNGKWLVFSSKADSAYTQLFLTHIDAQGRSTPPVLLSHFAAPDRAANIPEFVNAPPSAIKQIREQFLDDYSFVRAGNEFFRAGEADDAIRKYKKALELNPDNVEAHQKLGFLLYHVKQVHGEGIEHSATALRLDPNNALAHYDLGMSLLHRREFDKAVRHLSRALRLMPNGRGEQYHPVDMRHHLAQALMFSGKTEEGLGHLYDALRVDPKSAKTHYALAVVLAARGEIDTTVEHYSAAVRLQPSIDTSALLHHWLAESYARAGRFREALLSAEKAFGLARTQGDQELVRTVRQRIELYKQKAPVPRPRPFEDGSSGIREPGP